MSLLKEKYKLPSVGTLLEEASSEEKWEKVGK